MALSRVLAVDTGAGHVTCGAFSAKGGRLALDRFALDSFNPDAALEGQWDKAIAESLAAGLKREKLGGAAAVAVPGHLTLTKFIKTPSVEKAKRAKIIQFEAQQNIPYPLEEVTWDHCVVADDGLDIELMLAAAKADVAEKVCAALIEAGINPRSVIPSVYAIFRAFRYTHAAAENVLVVSIGARSTHLLFVDKEKFFSRTIPLAGNSLTQAISDEIKQDFPHAESLKVQVLGGRSELAENSPARKAVQSAVQGFVGQLHPEIARSILSYRRQTGTGQPATIYLVGGGSLIPNLPDLLADKLRIPVERFDPLKNVDVAAGAAEARERSAVLAELVGAAVIRSEQKTEVNLLPPTLRAAAAFRRQQPYYVAAAACVVLALALPAMGFRQTAQEAKKKINLIENDVSRMEAINKTNEENDKKLKAALAEIQDIRDLAARKSNWINFFTDLQGRLHEIEDVWLDELKVQRIDTSLQQQGSASYSDAKPDPSEGPPATLHLKIKGRLVDRQHPTSQVSPDSTVKVQQLVAAFNTSPFIKPPKRDSAGAATFVRDIPGVLQFEFTLEVSPSKPL
jgi:type IV pilus assembly protein PilM